MLRNANESKLEGKQLMRYNCFIPDSVRQFSCHCHSYARVTVATAVGVKRWALTGSDLAITF